MYEKFSLVVCKSENLGLCEQPIVNISRFDRLTLLRV